MKFSTVLFAFGLVAAVSAQTKASSSAAPVESSSYTQAQQKCMSGCGSNLSCIAECFGNPAPTEDMVHRTTKCMGDCKQGDGTAEQTAAYAACQQKCIADQFYSNGSGAKSAAATGTGTAAAATGTGSYVSPSQSADSSLTVSRSSKATGTGAGSEGSTPTSSKSSASASASGSSAANTYGAPGLAGLLGVVAAFVL
ncbi:hypothetical protein K440DRAFT_317821 [Wilcoxina mikolae CBS 423.85]|nr:hypothetical protein K440DRAFT_317821 [Wilcoxina mikolae CBS 423.85]